jgi:hypothetical protein
MFFDYFDSDENLSLTLILSYAQFPYLTILYLNYSSEKDSIFVKSHQYELIYYYGIKEYNVLLVINSLKYYEY